MGESPKGDMSKVAARRKAPLETPTDLKSNAVKDISAALTTLFSVRGLGATQNDQRTAGAASAPPGTRARSAAWPSARCPGRPVIAGASLHLRIFIRSYHHLCRLVPWPALSSPSHP